MTVRFIAETILKETQKALLIRQDGIDMWIPKTQVENFAFLDDGQVLFAISDWIAGEKGIPDETEKIRALVSAGQRPTVRRRSEKPPPFKPQPTAINASASSAVELDIEPQSHGGDVFAESKPKLSLVSKKVVRVLLAHAKSDSEGTIAQMRSTLIQMLSRAAGGTATIEVVLGREDFDANFKRCGGWDAWARDIIDRIDFGTREPVYKAIAVTSVYVGKATAQMVNFALQAGRTTFLLNGPSIEAVKGIDQVTDSFQTGWRIRT